MTESEKERGGTQSTVGLLHSLDNDKKQNREGKTVIDQNGLHHASAEVGDERVGQAEIPSQEIVNIGSDKKQQKGDTLLVSVNESVEQHKKKNLHLAGNKEILVVTPSSVSPSLSMGGSGPSSVECNDPTFSDRQVKSAVAPDKTTTSVEKSQESESVLPLAGESVAGKVSPPNAMIGDIKQAPPSYPLSFIPEQKSIPHTEQEPRVGVPAPAATTGSQVSQVLSGTQTASLHEIHLPQATGLMEQPQQDVTVNPSPKEPPSLVALQTHQPPLQFVDGSKIAVVNLSNSLSTVPPAIGSISEDGSNGEPKNTPEPTFSGLKSKSQRGTRPRSNSVPNSPSKNDPTSKIVKATPRQKPTPNKPTTALRRGKWTVEEEAYVARVIQDFNSGFLNAPAGTTLRTYLSEKLHCDPMRITKKFTGDSCIGKRVFHPAVRCANNASAIDKAQAELDGLERRWRRRLEHQQKESAKKAAASAAAAAAASERHNLHSSQFSAGAIMKNSNSQTSLLNTQELKENVVVKTASWLDRANAILSRKPVSAGVEYQSAALEKTVEKVQQNEVQTQIEEVQRLIHEGPTIQKTSAGLPTLLQVPATISQPNMISVVVGDGNSCSVPNTHEIDKSFVATTTNQGNAPSTVSFSGLTAQKEETLLIAPRPISTGDVAAAAPPQVPNQSDDSVTADSPPVQSQPKRARKAFSSDHLSSMTSDAEALVGFLNSVRSESFKAAATSTSTDNNNFAG